MPPVHSTTTLQSLPVNDDGQRHVPAAVLHTPAPLQSPGHAFGSVFSGGLFTLALAFSAAVHVELAQTVNMPPALRPETSGSASTDAMAGGRVYVPARRTRSGIEGARAVGCAEQHLDGIVNTCKDVQGCSAR
jgi:Flp pilus assembly secretin CpaC